jgi:methyl-accepting chemotaxis protein
VSEKFGKWVVKSTVFDKWGYFIIAAYPIKDIETRVNVVKTGLLISAIIFGLVIIIILYVLVNKMILAYVKQLAVASEKVSKGDTTIKVKINTKDEIGLLADSFNNMVEGINESILQ